MTSKDCQYLQLNDNTHIVVPCWTRNFYLVEIYGIAMKIICKILKYFQKVANRNNKEDINIYKFIHIIRSHLRKVAPRTYDMWLETADYKIKTLCIMSLDFCGRRRIQTIQCKTSGFDEITLPKLYWLLTGLVQHYVAYGLKWNPDLYPELYDEYNHKFYQGEYMSDMVCLENEVMKLSKMTNESNYGQRAYCRVELAENCEHLYAKWKLNYK